jgi:D-aspartate ligase
MATAGRTRPLARRGRSRPRPGPALVMGDIDLVRALGLAGIPVAFFGVPDASARFSRHVKVVLPWIDHWRRQDELLAALMAFGRSRREAPVLYPQTDAALLLASRHRDELGTAFRLMLADAELIEQLVDKGRFDALARREALPVPRAERLSPRPGQAPPDLGLSFPVVLKPLTRGVAWAALGGAGKAMHIGGPDAWAAIWARIADTHSEVIVQELVDGPESAIESYHAYIDDDGAIVGEFTGRKIRTFPRDYGHSTAVEVVALPDVAELGRDVIARLALKGLAKLDFKRDDAGRLHLLEINPRFNLWHYPGAIAGVNLPALAYADLTGHQRPPVAARPHRVAWVDPLQDMRAARADGVSPLRWLRFLAGCRAICGLARADPAPFLRGKLWGAVWRRAVSRVRGGRTGPTAPTGPGAAPDSSA